MTQRSLQLGDVVTANFPEQMPKGREQQGYRPAIVVAIPDLFDIPRFPLIVVIPLTTDRGQEWAIASSHLYPRFLAGVAGLRSPSIALLDQVRALDISRVTAYRGSLSSEEYQPILSGFQRMFNWTPVS
ncbi:MAG: type II toxin-antitoxin system PemK/MazF family toxin [Cyanobacteria bacterium CAN_BIN43]|nr:type II toxin-antitoxin system PemK/MazF family toxin [Cyanobacteria bacterium CAN_BIN43]